VKQAEGNVLSLQRNTTVAKYVIDTEAMANDMSDVPFEDRGEYALAALRGLHSGEMVLGWASVYKMATKACPKKYSFEFEEFWKCYPRKVGKGGAWKAWWKAADGKEGELCRLCLESLTWQRDSDQWTNEDGKFIPHAATWLNQARWEDEDPNKGRGMEEYLGDDGTIKWRHKT
jgi:hypothetical protein